MQRLKFLSKNDFTALDMMIQEKIANWSRDWVFTTAFDLVIEEITFADHIEKDAKILSIIGHSDHELLLIERKFSWGRFIFNEEFEGCPEDSVMYSVSRAVERSFWSEVFNLDASSSEEVSTAAPRKTSFKGGVKVVLTVPNAGVIELIATPTVFASLINKPRVKSPKAVLSTRFEAVANMSVELSVFMKFGQVSFSDLVKLKVGNPIQSKIDVDNNFHLKVNKAPLCRVALGKTNGFKSVSVKEIYND